MSKRYDLVGQKFGILTVLGIYGHDKFGAVKWDCVCDCGNHTYPKTHDLLIGKSTSCGCKRNQSIKMVNYKHGESYTRLFRCWQSIKRRCFAKTSKDYAQYGGRGITISDEWKNDFRCFMDWALANGYDDSLTIDRIDVNGNYEPSNCRWANDYIQANNRTNNHIVTYHGKADTLTNMCRKLNVNYCVIKRRMCYGRSFEDSIDKFQHTSPFVEYWKK